MTMVWELANGAGIPAPSDAARGKFVSGAKVLAAVPSMSQPKEFTRIDLTLAGRERVFNKH